MTRATPLLIVCMWLVTSWVLAQPVPPTTHVQSHAVAGAALGAAPSVGRDNCDQAKDRLAQVLCGGKLTVGLRADYPPYSSTVGNHFVGFEADMASELATRLGVKPIFSAVTPANRIALLGEGRVDVTVATMGHTVQRDGEVLFVMPHYYQSQTVVLGRKEVQVNTLDQLRGQTVCVTLGNSTNAELAAAGARLMIFDNAPRLVDALITGSCSLIAQDDSFLARYLQQSDFAAAYDVKFGFAPLSWGMAVGRGGSNTLAAQLGKALERMHADGTIQQLARKHGVDLPFLETQQQLWKSGVCDGAMASAGCAPAPRDSRLAPTRFAPTVDVLEERIKQVTGVKVTLAMLKTQVAVELFAEGVAFSLALVLGAVASTIAFALLFGQTLDSRFRLVRWPMRTLLATMQSTPLILLMVLAGVVVSALKPGSPWPALLGAITVLGLYNGSNAGQAITEAMAVLKAQTASHKDGEHQGVASLAAAVRMASAQMVAFVVNSTRGSACASFIGVPELLSASTDIASFSSERITTYTLLLIFYTGVVGTVAYFANRWRVRTLGLAHV